MHLKFSISCEIKKSACLQPDLALHQTTSETKEFIVGRDPVCASPLPDAVLSAAPALPSLSGHRLQLRADTAAAGPCTARAASAGLRPLRVCSFPCCRQALLCSGSKGVQERSVPANGASSCSELAAESLQHKGGLYRVIHQRSQD